MNYSESEIAFLESEAVNGKTSTMDSSAAYVRNLDRGIKEKYEAIYRRLINPKFVLCYWCGNEVFAMVRDVHKTYNIWKAAEAYKEKANEEPIEPLPFKAVVSVSEVIESQKRIKRAK